MSQGRTHGAVARAALLRMRSRDSGQAGTGADTGAHLGDPADQVDDARVAAEVARILESLAAQIRQNGLERVGDLLADGQPNQLTVMPETQDPPINDDALLSAQGLAEYLGVNVRTLRRWRHEGRIPDPISIGRAQRWRRTDVDRWLEGGRG